MSTNEHDLSWLVIASSSTNKINAYRDYPFASVDSRNPEEASGTREIESDDSALVAWMKAAVVLDAIAETQAEYPTCYVTGVDILSSYKCGDIQTPDPWTTLHKAKKTDEREEKILVQDTKGLYCQTPFTFRWHVSTAVIQEMKSVSNVSAIEIFAEFPPLPESIVDMAATTGKIYKMSPRIPLAVLADKYAYRVVCKNRDSTERAINISEETLIKLVIEGILPYNHFARLLAPTAASRRIEPYSIIHLDLSKGFKYRKRE